MSDPEVRSTPITLDEQVARLIADDLIIGGFFDPRCADHEIEAIALVKEQLMAGDKTLIRKIFEIYFEDENTLGSLRVINLIATQKGLYTGSSQIIIPEISKQLTEFLAFPPEKQRSLAVEIKQAKEA